ncbi:hypothetical protein ACPCHQ_17050 [Ralstonia thomasii]|jgi:hypothetical protein|uniref:Uncharacterized protein n=2 Tax=Ralstonia TaxID=48736 RepID=A0ABM9JWU2_9RALS|nr:MULTISPECIES: hypothetical protein [Ralstonia]MBT2181016.1 hypothetical protein [Ralstonia pickettii]CAJ0710701.1 hypothetical protein LMG7143_01694 [Ralstonia sp. LMG 18095]CAJ0806261.1 hypothetical protein LMG18095_04411 [Ralstonia sp. LMG 18095]
MFPVNTLLRPNGKTVALSVAATSHAAVTVTAADNTQQGYAALLNTGTTTVAITMDPSSAPAAVLPTDGSPTGTIILPPSMTQPLYVPTPGASFSVAAIGSGAGPALVYITPMAV